MPDSICPDRLEELELQLPKCREEAVATKEQMLREINKRRVMEEALKKSERKLRAVMSQLLNVQEQERRRIAFEMHDELGSSLTALKMNLRRFEKQLPADWGPQRQELEGCLTDINHIITNVRRISRDLSPTILEDLGLPAALRLMIREFEKHYGIKVSFDGEELKGTFSQETKILVYRIMQECLNNIGKHAEAQNVFISLKRHPKCLSFRVADDGKGFNLEEAQTRNADEKGMGLGAMRERVRMLGGILKIESRPSGGTELFFTVPMSG